jgi:hypothetical protein
MNALVMYDRQSNSLWSQILGEAVAGPLKGTKLEYVAAEHTTWAEWKTQHPQTTALVKGYSGARDSYDSYYASSSAGVLGETRRDTRLPAKEFVLGVEHNGDAVAYAFRDLLKRPVVNDEIGGVPALIVFNSRGGSGVAFERRLDGTRTLTFSSKEGLTLTDTETGSTWQGMDGIAIAGPLAGKSLAPLKSTTAFWFGWKDWYPATRVFGQ